MILTSFDAQYMTFIEKKYFQVQKMIIWLFLENFWLIFIFLVNFIENERLMVEQWF